MAISHSQVVAASAATASQRRREQRAMVDEICRTLPDLPKAVTQIGLGLELGLGLGLELGLGLGLQLGLGLGLGLVLELGPGLGLGLGFGFCSLVLAWQGTAGAALRIIDYGLVPDQLRVSEDHDHVY